MNYCGSPLECPYCEAGIPDPEECYSTDTVYEHECEDCGKTFVFCVEYTRVYYSSQAPCRNGGEHDYQPITGYPKEYFKGRKRCSYCGDEIEEVPAPMSDQAYIALCKCGCGGLIFAAVDKPEYAKDNAKEISGLILDGYSVERMTAEEVRRADWGCKRKREVPAP